MDNPHSFTKGKFLEVGESSKFLETQHPLCMNNAQNNKINEKFLYTFTYMIHD